MAGKYNATKTYVDDIKFDSASEASRYALLLLKKEKGLIDNLVLQQKYLIHINGIYICKYIADFTYIDCETGKIVCEDVKNKHLAKTPLFSLKRKLVKAVHGFDIKIVDSKDVLGS